ncbi:hypothetical protein G6F70_001695 [Rhizopus microsporus]|uniref:RNA-binding domain-containing protein n=2 Tax=Rhizopus TaxID=4842 RepID=A0A0A1MPX8_RHIZD|nr:hypothetical protein G6F71_001721 [Rhizopus microsporus]KAG1203077.1 hypothetical protein G6F70_001695 [Rhizopus microsporus]KAG1215377.1 hypothetical protein G6F69_001052 [Rhizopus microsporus]KAG1237212.1 hypothetical protein G6F67_001374 [Rhizopus microsporus]KAG1268744.1 hypothetical protein G6F68_000873 [Rhizopus microsporus]
MNNPGALDMALDDVISQNRKRNQRSTTSSRGGINKRRGTRPSSSPYNRPRRTNAPPTRSNIPPRSSAPSRSNSLVVSNLHYNVTEKDLYDLFGQIGKLKRAFLHIGPNGKSAGIADVVFVNANDAERARVTYNNVQLDGRPMRITTASIISSVSAPSNSRPRGNNTRRPTRGGGSGRRENRPKPSQQDLDADMDSYMGVAGEDTQMN